MSWVRWFNLGVGALGALGAIALLLATPRNDGSLGHSATVGIAAALAILPAASVWLLGRRQAAELRRLAEHIDAGGSGDASPFKGDPELAGVAGAVDRVAGQCRKRADELTGKRRELEVQARIAEAERRHADAILNALSDAVVVTDAFNEVAIANEAAARVLGFELGEARRRPIDRVISDPILIKLIKDMREGGVAPGLRRHVEHRIGRNDTRAVYDVTLACVADAHSGGTGGAGSSATSTASRGNGASPAVPAGVVTILHDITRDKEIAEMKSDFVSNVSHELRTPLSSIKAYIEMLMDGEAQDEQTRGEFYSIIQGEANRLSRLIDNILNISRIESGVVKVQREHVSLPALIKEAIEVMQPQARAKQIELVEVPTPVFFRVFADKDMIYQTLLNLISNAIKYTLPGGKVMASIAVDEHAKRVSVSVADSGVGIPPSDLPHLFEKFFRVADHKKLAKGTGLGLNLVKHIVETVHGGEVSVNSEVGKGSTFTFKLPMADGDS